MAHLNSLFLNPVILQLDYWCILCIFHFEILLIIRCFQVFRIPLPFFFLTFTFHFFSHVSRHAECGLMIMNCQTTSVVFGGWCILVAFLWVNEAACFWLSQTFWYWMCSVVVLSNHKYFFLCSYQLEHFIEEVVSGSAEVFNVLYIHFMPLWFHICIS